DQCRQQRRAVEELEAGLTSTETQLARLREQIEHDRNDHLEQMRLTARLQNDAVTNKNELDNLIRERSRLRARSEQAAEGMASLDDQLQELNRAEEELQGRLAAARSGQAEQRGELDRLNQAREDTRQR